MKRVLPCASLVVLSVLASAPPARADIIDWLQELSGPGPYKFGGAVLTTLCGTNRSRLIQDYDPSSNKLCFYADLHRYVPRDDSKNQENFPATVDAQVYDFGLVWRVSRPVDIGLGAGVFHFTSDGGSPTRFTLTFPRIVVKPVLFVPYLLGKATYWDSHEKAARLWSSIKWYARQNVIVGTLDADDFGVGRLSSFKAEDDRVLSVGFVFDVIELIDGLRPGIR